MLAAFVLRRPLLIVTTLNKTLRPIADDVMKWLSVFLADRTHLVAWATMISSRLLPCYLLCYLKGQY